MLERAYVIKIERANQMFKVEYRTIGGEWQSEVVSGVINLVDTIKRYRGLGFEVRCISSGRNISK